MKDQIRTTLAQLSRDPALLEFNRGIEREALRVSLDGKLAQTPHPEFLGSKLCNPQITTDFSESQLELITPVNSSVRGAIDTLNNVHRFIYSGLENEVMWSASMPCIVPDDNNIPLAYYGTSNLGKLKTTYRTGLGHRYGRAMQTICAIHYNFSFSDAFWQTLATLEQSTESQQQFRSRRYFDLMRNFRRYSWLLIYLFGASPAVCKSFLTNRKHFLTELDTGTAYSPFGTSLRNGDLGYQSESQSDLVNICYNSLEDYVDTLNEAICTPHPTFSGMQSDMAHPQVNGNVLQSEAEFYTTVRAKRVPAKGENFLAALRRDGVEYIEVRLLDINPYLPTGIDESEIRFLDAFLLYCLLIDSPEHDTLLCNEVSENIERVVAEGRSPELALDDNGKAKSLRQWGGSILDGIAQVSETLDLASTEPGYTDALNVQRNRLQNPETTPSGQILEDMAKEEIPFFRFAMNQALNHQRAFKDAPLADADQRAFEQMSQASLEAQVTMERSEKLSFDEFLAQRQLEYEQLRS